MKPATVAPQLEANHPLLPHTLLHRMRLIPLAVMAFAMVACSKSADDSAMTTEPRPVAATSNPFFSPSALPFQYPQFDQISIDHYRPAFERGMEQELAEIDAIANQSEAPTVENTLAAMEQAGATLSRVSRVFYALTSAHTNDDLEAIRSEIAPKLAAHRDQILLNPYLFQRVKALYDDRDSLDVDSETGRLIEEMYTGFVRAGAQLAEPEKKRLRALNGELAELQTTFSQNVLKEVNGSAVVVDNREQLAGWPESDIQAAADKAADQELDGKFVIPLLNTSDQPPLAYLQDRALRERIHNASLARGSQGGEFDNRKALVRIVELRAERAKLLGYDTHADYALENQTAQTVAAVNERLESLIPPAVDNAKQEAAALQEMISAEGGDFQLAPWDWAYYTEKLRRARYDFDAAELRPYFEMDNVLEKGVFYAANKLYGLSFKERTDLPVYQEDVRVFDVFDADGSQLSVFIADFYARPSKRGGAWMNAYVSQSKLLNTQSVIANHLNVPKPPAGEPTLLTFDEVTTMFHEFGHALHGMFSNVTYPYFSGTSVPRDFVEYPSQVNEMWATWPEVLENYAVHYETGEAMPTELLDKVLASQKFNQGFSTTEYLAASLIDQSWHQLPAEQVPSAEEVAAFEARALEEAGFDPEAVPPRYRSTYFSHIMGGYAAGYYSYIWSEVLDADSVEWFKESGGLTRENGDHFRETLLSRGGSEEALTLFKNFRGAEPDVGPLLERRGLIPAAE